MIETRLEEVRASSALDEEAVAKLAGLYRNALPFIKVRESNDAAAGAFARARTSAPAKTKALKVRIDELQAEPAEVVLEIPDDPSVSAIEQLVQQENANQAALSAKLAIIDQQIASASERPAVVRERLLDLSQLTDKLSDDLELVPRQDAPAVLVGG